MSPTTNPEIREPRAEPSLKVAADPAIGHAFLSAYATRNWGTLRSLLHADVTWDLPGVGPIAGRAAGIDAVIDRVKKIVDGGTQTQLLYVLTGSSGIALSLHNTGQTADGRVLDEHLITLLRVDEDRIRAVETYLSDVEMMQAFYAASPVI